MSILSLAEKTFDIQSPQNLFEQLYNKGYIKENSLEKIYQDPLFKGLQKIKVSENNQYDENKCSAREWRVENIDNIDYVLDNVQCQKGKMDGSCFCKFHHKKNEIMPKGWWLGKVNEPRPEPLYHPGHINHISGIYENPIHHKWKYEIQKSKNTDINEVIENNDTNNNSKVKPKKKRGRPPGSKNKKKKTDSIKGNQKNKSKTKSKTTNEKLFSFDYEEENDSVKYEVDGFAYSLNLEGDVINPHTYDYMGCKDNHGGITFIDNDALEKHKINISNI